MATADSPEMMILSSIRESAQEKCIVKILCGAFGALRGELRECLFAAAGPDNEDNGTFWGEDHAGRPWRIQLC